MTFDAVAYKATTKEQWDEASAAWHRWGPTLEEWLGESTEAMLDAAGVGEGSRVLDVAGGAGGQALAAARRTGPDGSVVVTDLSPGILGYAELAADEPDYATSRPPWSTARRSAARGHRSSTRSSAGWGSSTSPTRRAPCSASAPASVKVAGSRPSSTRRPTGTRSSRCRSGLIRQRAGLGAPLPGQPGPFSLGDPAAARDALVAAGFRDVDVQTLSAPLRLPSAADCVRFERESFGALHQMLSGVPEDERAQVWADIELALREYETGDGFVGPCELHVLSGTR